MPTQFIYRAANSAGEVLQGRVSSASRAAALEDLHRQKLYPIELNEDSPRTAAGSKSRIGRRDAVGVWTRSMATLLSAGVNLERALSLTAAQTRNSEVALAVADIRSDVHKGLSLTAAMRRHSRLFGGVQVALIAAGEETGTLAVVMQRLADHLDEENEMRGRVRSALMYPAIMAFVTMLGLLIMVVFVVPRLADMLEDAGGTLPLSTRMLVGISGFMVTWWPLILAAAALLLWEFRRWSGVPANRMKWHAMRLRIPIAGDLEREMIAARFTRTIALLLANGTPILSALRIARAAVTNEFLAGAIDTAATGVSQGRRLTTELADVLPPEALQLMSVGEETGRLAELSLRAAESYESELARRIRTLIGFIEPALIIVFGGIVGFVAIAMLQAIYSINGRIS